MHAWEIAELGKLRWVERDDEKLGPLDARIRITACSINFRDHMVAQGTYNPRQKLPLVPLSDGVGIVEEIGASVERVKVGDRVAAIFAQRWMYGAPTRELASSTLGSPLDGMARTHAVLRADGLVHVPEHLSDEEAATLPCAGVTAWSALFELSSVSASDTILVQGTGGVSMFALQLACMAGARVIVTSSSDEKLEVAKKHGAYKTINYKHEPEWSRAVRALTSNTGVDQVIEVGGAGTIEQSIAAVRNGGTISVIGALAGGAGPVPLVHVLMRQLRMQGVFVGPRQAFENLVRAIDIHRIKPVVGATYSLRELPEALERLKSGAHIGKIALRLEA